VSYRIRFEQRVLGDVENARAWYERRVVGLGDRLENEFYAALEEIVGHPMACSPYAAARQSGVRHYLLASFPYTVYFDVKRDVVRVLLLFHGARNPATLRRELRRRMS
jgi:plasmid stabilization system protein ParE